jgi:hypothetical protein
MRRVRGCASARSPVPALGRARRRICLAVPLAACCAAHLVPTTAGAVSVRSEFYGITQTATLDDRDMQGMRAARVHANRFLLNWGAIEPRQGVFTWGSTDRFIGRLASQGIRAFPSVWGNPGWLAGSSSTPPVGGTRAQKQWRSFLQALVARYRPGGTYWTTYYHQRFGAGASELPITSWQVWNEPNLKKYFAPYPSPGQYARLLQISYPTIKAIDPAAQVSLAGMPGFGDVKAWDFLKRLYSYPGIKSRFDAVAIHPYGPGVNTVKSEIKRTRTVMSGHADAATPLWISEIAWGSAHPDRIGINKGLMGQAKLLRGAFKLIVSNRTAWNVQHLFWYHWRDPRFSQASCSFCASAGLLRFNRRAKPAMAAFKSFTTERKRPRAAITAGPAQGSTITYARPRFRFRANEAGSMFQCRFDAKAFAPCSSPLTLQAALSNGRHTFHVRAIDAAGNASHIVSRSFTVNLH